MGVVQKRKTCAHCGQALPLSRFYVRETGRPGSWCKDCIYQRNKAVRAGMKTYNPKVDVWSHRRRKYGLSREGFEALYEEQDGRCAICRRRASGKGLCVDHDHSSGVVRGLLCPTCNFALGNMRDNDDWLEAAITYLHHGFVGDGACS